MIKSADIFVQILSFKFKTEFLLCFYLASVLAVNLYLKKINGLNVIFFSYYFYSMFENIFTLLLIRKIDTFQEKIEDKENLLLIKRKSFFQFTAKKKFYK